MCSTRDEFRELMRSIRELGGEYTWCMMKKQDASIDASPGTPEPRARDVSEL